jgi:hypothetical protein
MYQQKVMIHQQRSWTLRVIKTSTLLSNLVDVEVRAAGMNKMSIQHVCELIDLSDLTHIHLSLFANPHRLDLDAYLLMVDSATGN